MYFHAIKMCFFYFLKKSKHMCILVKKGDYQMELRDYLHINRISNNDFAEMIDYTPQYISQTIHGWLLSGTKYKKRVFNATNGQVGYDEWPTEKRKVKKNEQVKKEF